MSLDQLIVLMRTPPSGEIPNPFARPASLSWVKDLAIKPPPHRPYQSCNQEAQDGKKYPVATHPENQPCIIAVPAAALVIGEETPGMVVVIIFRQDSYPSPVDITIRDHVFFPHDREKERARTIHDGNIWKTPTPVVRLKRLNYAEEERMARDCAHGVI